MFEAEEILLYMQLKRQQITIILSRVKDEKIMNNCISAETLEKCVLQYYIRKHDEKIEPIYKLFREVDDD